MDRFWLLSSTFYGNWLPGDQRGFVSRVRDRRPYESIVSTRRDHDVPSTPYDQDLPGLHRAARGQLSSEPVRVNGDQARALIEQFHETAGFRNWQLMAASVMSNHMHIVVGVPGDPDPSKILGDFKAYGSRALNKVWGRPAGGTWWTYDGSKRKLKDETAILAAIAYVLDQSSSLASWCRPEYLELLGRPARR